MSTTRRFLLASSLARFIETGRGRHRITKGYFPARGDRSTYVQVQDRACRLVLVTANSGAMMEGPAEIPHSHASALCGAAAGRVDYLRSALSLGSCPVAISHFALPGLLKLVLVRFENYSDTRAFAPPPWLGSEVTQDATYQNRQMALEGLPPAPEVPLTDIALNRLLDTLEGEADALSDQGQEALPFPPLKGDSISRA